MVNFRITGRLFQSAFSLKYLHPDQINYKLDEEEGKKKKSCAGITSRKWAGICSIFTYRDKLWSFPSGWSHMCNSISMRGPPPRSQRGEGVQPGAAKNHICLDKNRSMPRNRIQKQREIPNKVVQYADHTATEAASLFASTNTEVNVARLSDTFLGRLWVWTALNYDSFNHT